MKHFTVARNEAIRKIQEDSSSLSRIKRLCLIWDIKGLLRLLFEATESENNQEIKNELSTILRDAAGPFWSGEVWVWSKDSTQAERAVYEAAWNNAVQEQDAGPTEIRILDRHYSKGSWFTPPLDNPWPLNERTPPILSFYSFKGGVGRTTALASLAIQLARNGKKVAIIDLDLEAPGLSTIFPGAEGQTATHGVVDYLLEKPIIPQGEIDLEDFYHLIDDSAIVGGGPPITVIPAGNLDASYLEKLARMDYEAIYQKQGGTTPLQELLNHIRSQRQIDYILLDSRAGLHDLGGLALSGISHLDVLFGLNNEQSWRGMELVINFLGRNRIIRNQKQLHCALVFTLAPETGSKREETFQRFLERSYQLFSDYYYDEEGADPEEAWPLPGMQDSDHPHYPIIIGFNPLIQRYDQVKDIAQYLSDGDFKEFARLILERIGRTLS
jgi:hypothetical protein